MRVEKSAGLGSSAEALAREVDAGGSSPATDGGESSRALVQGRALAAILARAAAAGKQGSGADAAAAALAVHDGSAGKLSVETDGRRRIPTRTIRTAARVLRSRSALLLTDLARGTGARWRSCAAAGFRSLAAVPFRLGPDEGCLLVASDAPGRFAASDVDALVAVIRRAAREHLNAAVRIGQQRLTAWLHDTLGQTLTSLTFTIDDLDRALETDAQRQLAGVVRERAITAVRELRSVLDASSLARGPVGPENQLARLLEELARSGIAFRLTDRLGDALLPDEVATCLYQVAHETLLNIRRHAGARSVRMKISRGARAVVLEVADDGRGLGPREGASNGCGVGLDLMRQRVEDLGGRLIIASIPGKGTKIAVSLPCPRC